MSKSEDNPYNEERYIKIPDCLGVFNEKGELQYVIREKYKHLATNIPPNYSKQYLFRADRYTHR